MKILIVDNGTKYLSKLKGLFDGDETHIIPWKKISTRTAKPFDLVVLSGAHQYSIVHHPARWKREIQFIQRTKKPLIGICMGFELIARAYGATLTRLKKRQKGILTIRTNGRTWGKKKVRVYENHRWVVEKNGKKLLTLARSTKGIEAIRHRKKSVWGVQFHPEMFTRKTDGKTLFTRLIHEARAE